MKIPLIVLPFFLLMTGALFAADPFFGYVHPCGAQRGTRVKLLIGGQYLHNGIGVSVSGPGVKVLSVQNVPVFPPPPWKQKKYLISKLKNIEKGIMDQPSLPPEKEMDGWRKNLWWEKLEKLDDFQRLLVVLDLHTMRNALQTTPSLRQKMIVELEIASDAPVGKRTIRLYSRLGISAPKTFFIDSVPHTGQVLFTPPWHPKAPIPNPGKFPAILDGFIMPGKTESFTVRLEKGKDYYFRLTGRALQPYIGDAVPGFFQPVLILTDKEGKEIAFADDEGSNPDPVLRLCAPGTGEYTLSVRDNLFRGREDFLFRIECMEGVLPPFCAKISDVQSGIRQIPLKQALKEIWDLPEKRIISDILGNGETLKFRFRGLAREKFSARTIAATLGSNADTRLRLFDPKGKLVVENDDEIRSVNFGSVPRQTDSAILTELPIDGVYTLELSERTGRGGKAYYFHLLAGKPSPDFRVFSEKSSLVFTPGSRVTLSYIVDRIDGFTGPLEFSSPDFDILSEKRIPSGVTSGKLILRSKFRITEHLKRGTIIVRGKTGDEEIIRELTACDKSMQAFAYDHLLPSPDGLQYRIYPVSKREMKQKNGRRKKDAEKPRRGNL